MPRKNSYITITDQFCGAGGSSQGARRALHRAGIGPEGIKLALNHWKLAIETHNTNFPDTLHDCTDISACDPRRYPSTDILITSPECTTHSPAGGNTHKRLKAQMDLFNTGKVDAATERSRATMWDVVRFAEYHRYRRIIVENVVEAKTNWPLFDQWLSTMHTLGYFHRLVFHNSMHHHPTPQSRDRMYVVFWLKGDKAPMLDYTPAAHCPSCAKDVLSVQTFKDKRKNWGKYRKQYVYCCPSCSTVVEPYYYAAFNCIDWSDIGTRIGDRKKPLAAKTIARIQYGLNKYGKQPIVVTQKYDSEKAHNTVKDSFSPLRCQPTQAAHGILTPFLVYNKQNSGVGCRVKGTDQPTATMHTDPRLHVVSHPFILKLENASASSAGNVRSSTECFPTHTRTDSGGVVLPFIFASNHGGDMRPVSREKFAQTCQQSEALVTVPFVTELRGSSKARPATRELNGITAGGIASGIVTSESWNSFIASYYGGSNVTSGINEVVNTQGTKERHQLITYQAPAIEDCYYRMLFPHEIQLAMAFENEYVVLGSSKDKVKQLGNAVTPPAMEWLVERCIESLS